MSQNFDLFGDPIPEGFGKRGRPPHTPTDENRNKIMILMRMEWTDERIARSLGITKPTLKKHYFRELKFRSEARDRVDGVRLMMLWTQMREGNVAAMKEYSRIVEKLDVDNAAKGFETGQDAPAAPIGKKEAAQLAADTAGEGTDWGNDLVGTGSTQH